MTTLKDAMQTVMDAVVNTGMEINFGADGVQIHWNGVNQLDCNAEDAAKVVPHIKALEKLGMKDC